MEDSINNASIDKFDLECAIEAVLFAMGHPVEIDMMVSAFSVDREEIISCVEKLKEGYNQARRGFDIIKVENAYQLCTRKEYYKYVEVIVGEKKKQELSQSAMEVLAIIAYNQPITKSTIDNIRGISCDYQVSKLIERGLIEDFGRLDAPGRPVLYVTTADFLKCFGLDSIDELPNLEGVF